MKRSANVAQVARANDINANLLFDWRYQYKLGKLTSDNRQCAAILPFVFSPEKAPEAHVPATTVAKRIYKTQRLQHLPASTLRLSGTITAAMLQALVRELDEAEKR